MPVLPNYRYLPLADVMVIPQHEGGNYYRVKISGTESGKNES